MEPPLCCPGKGGRERRRRKALRVGAGRGRLRGTGNPGGEGGADIRAGGIAGARDLGEPKLFRLKPTRTRVRPGRGVGSTTAASGTQRQDLKTKRGGRAPGL